MLLDDTCKSVHMVCKRQLATWQQPQVDCQVVLQASLLRMYSEHNNHGAPVWQELVAGAVS